MNILRTPAWAIAMAITMTVALALCGTSANAGTTNYYSNLSINLTIEYTLETSSLDGKFKDTIHSEKINNKSLLDLFATADFADKSFPSGAQLVMSWDGAQAGHVLVMNQSKSDILYDATEGTTNTIDSLIPIIVTNSFSINFFNAKGARKGTGNSNNPGGYNLTQYNFANMSLMDNGSVANHGALVIAITGAGPCAETSKVSRNADGNVMSWTDSEDFTVAGAGVIAPGISQSTFNGTIKAGEHSASIPTGFGE